MSRAGSYVVTFDGEHIGHGVYDGTSDVLDPNLSRTTQEAWSVDNGRERRPDGRSPWDVLSECSHPRERGYAYSSYGGGFYWPVEFCRTCMIVHGPLNWDCLPPAWPKDGTPPIEACTSTAQLPKPPPV